MKTFKNITLTFALMFFLGSLQLNAQLTAADLYWNGASQATMSTLSNWSTNPDAATAPTSLDLANSVIGKMNWTASASAFIKIDTANTVLKGIYWGTPSGSYDSTFTAYNAVDNDTFTVTNGITLNDSNVSSAVIRIRRRQNSGTFAVNIGDINILQTGTIQLGYSDQGQYITSLNLTGDVNLVGSASSSLARLSIYANNFSISSGASVSLNNSILSFLKGTDESSAANPFSWCSIDLTDVVINAQNASTFQYGNAWNDVGSGDVALGDINITNADAILNINIYTSSENRSLGAITSTVAANSGSSFNLKTNYTDISAESMDVSLQTVLIAAKLNVTGNYRDWYSGGKSYIMLNNSSAAITIDGTFETANSSGLVFGKGLGSNNMSYNIGGITGTSGYITMARYGDSSASDTGITTFVLTGDGIYSTSTKITDMGWNTSTAVAGTSGALAIIKNGTGTQYMRGTTFYRGTTTVNAGRLYIRADSTGRSSDAETWGVGSVILNGGYFGAIGATTDYGTIYATDLTFAGGTLSYDIDAANFDVIKLINTSDIINAESAELIKFEFNVTNLELDTEYKIIEWDSLIGQLGYDVNDFNYEINGVENIQAVFAYSSLGDGLTVTFSAIPEPACYALLFGILALLPALRHRNKRNLINRDKIRGA